MPRKRLIQLGDELDAVVDRALAKSGEELNTLARRAIAEIVGRPELAASVARGRPRKTPPAAAKSPKTRRTRLAAKRSRG